MSKTVTVCVSLEPEYLESLDRVARTVGSRSAAVRKLLSLHSAANGLAEMELAYQEYYSDPEALKSSEELTKEMLSASSWLKAESTVKKGRKQREAGRHLKRVTSSSSTLPG